MSASFCSGFEFVKTHVTPDKKKFQQRVIIPYTSSRQGTYHTLQENLTAMQDACHIWVQLNELAHH